MRFTAAIVALAMSLLALGCAQQAPAPAAQADAPKPAAEQPAPAPKAAPPAAPETPAKAPAAEPPKGDRAAGLIEQLGSTDYAKREAATKELAAMGKEIIPALEKAAKDPDAERAGRARDLITLLGASEEDAKAPDIPGLAEAVRSNSGGPNVVVNGGGLQVGVQVVAVAGGGGAKGAGNVRTRFEMSDGETKRIVENDSGSATVAESKNGFSLTLAPKGGEAKTYSAASREEFKKKYPKTYAKYFGN